MSRATEDGGGTGNWGGSRGVSTTPLEGTKFCFELGNTLLKDLSLAESLAIIVGTLALATGSNALLAGGFTSVAFELALATVETEESYKMINGKEYH